MTDLPIEWIMIDGVPLGFSHDVYRIPKTPAVGTLSQYVECKFIPFNIPKDILKHTLVIFSNEEDAFVKAQEPVVALSKVLGLKIRKCLTKEAFFNTIKEIDRISSAVFWRSSSVWQLARISSRFSVEIINASLNPVLIP